MQIVEVRQHLARQLPGARLFLAGNRHLHHRAEDEALVAVDGGFPGAAGQNRGQGKKHS